MITRRKQLSVILRHDDLKDGETHRELHAVPRWVKVEEEGPKCSSLVTRM